MVNKSGVSDQIVSLPKGGGELKGLGEKFQPDLYTGTGNFSVPIAIPAGRNGLQPNLTLSYSTGNGNGPYGLGWNIGIPNISRKTSKGIPKYFDSYDASTGEPIWHDQEDIFVLSGSDDLVHVGKGFYRPRTEGLFSKIQRKNASDGKPCWIVTNKEGIKTIYGNSDNSRIFLVSDDNRVQIFQWLISETQDTFGNKVIYTYKHDNGLETLSSTSLNFSYEERNHTYNQVYLQSINYVDYKDQNTQEEKFLFKIELDYGEFEENGNKATQSWEVRTDRFSSYKSGFEIRTLRRCKRILIKRLDEAQGNYVLVKSYELKYTHDVLTNISLLQSVTLKGHKDTTNIQSFPPLTFEYTHFDVTKRRFENFSSKRTSSFPNTSLADPNYEIIDLFGNGLACIVNSSNLGWRYWRNNGNLNLDSPQSMKNSPSGVTLGQEGVQFADMDGDGSVDLLVTDESQKRGYYKKDNVKGEWTKFHPYRQTPTFSLKNPNVKLVDMNGDGIVDILATFDNYFLFIQNEGNEKSLEFKKPIQIKRINDLDKWPNIFFGSQDNKIFLGDMSGDGLQDIVMIHSGRVDYWPNMGYGKFGKRITMRNSPRLEYNFDPKRIFLTDVNGDGLADMVYVDFGKVHLWINQNGNSWSEKVTLNGTPQLSSTDSVRIVDMKGTGTAGILWSYNLNSSNRDQNYKFLDFTDGIKPLLLNHIINNLGADTKIEYRPSTFYYLKDVIVGKLWKTTLPFPVQVVARVEVYDHFSKGKLVTEYFYHHGYWDGKEREFRGFGRVDQRDTQYFKEYNEKRFTNVNQFTDIPVKFFSPPTETINWFHQGSIISLSTEQVKEQDFNDEYWQEDKALLSRAKEMNIFVENLPYTIKHNALRTLRGSLIRTEVYALDATDRQQRPYTITENLYGITSLPIDNSSHAMDVNNLEQEWRKNVFFPHSLATRTTKWERGSEPMTSFQFTDYYDKYGQSRIKINVSIPRGQKINEPTKPNNNPYLVTFDETQYIYKDDDDKTYIVNRVSSLTNYEVKDDRTMNVFDFKDKIMQGTLDSNIKSIIGQTINYYDGDPFMGMSFGELTHHGALVRTEKLVLTNDILKNAYENQIPPYMLSSLTTITPPLPATPTNMYPQEFLLKLKPRAGYHYRNSRDTSTTGYVYRRKWGSFGNDNGQFNHPRGIAIDSDTGEVYVADTGNGRIQKFDSKGNFIQIVISGLNVPVSIALDPTTKDLYVAEAIQSKIKKFSKSGVFIKEWGKYGSGQGEFKNIWGQIAVDSLGNVYVPDWDNHRVQLFTSNGTFLRVLNKDQTGQNEIRYPTGIDFDSLGNVYIVDGNALWKFSSNGNFLARKYRSDPKPPSAVAIDPSGGIYETYIYNNKIQKFGSDMSSLLFTWGGQGKGDGEFGNGQTENGLGPYGIDVNSKTGEIYIIDTANNRIQVFSTIFENGYYIQSDRRKYDFHDIGIGIGKGLVITKMGELDNKTVISYDKFYMLPIQIIDATGLVTLVSYDYDVLQPMQVIDVNGNRTTYKFTPIGLLNAIYVRGKKDINEGDLNRACKQFDHNLAAFMESNGRQPVYVHTVNYIYHDSEPLTSQELDKKIESRAYSDGFGRILQTRTQAEDLIFDEEKYGHINLSLDLSLPLSDTIGNEYINMERPRVLVSGFQSYNNKGQIVERYEPFFSKGWEYEPLAEDDSQKVTIFYDPLGRTVKTVNHDNSEHLVIYGSPRTLGNPELFDPSAWEAYNYDLNDNANRTHGNSLTSSYQHHWNTPSSSIFDALGRKIEYIERNGPDPINDWYKTKYTYDIKGNLLTVLDPLGRVASKQVYDLFNNTLRTELLDAGITLSFMDGSGNIIERRDSKGSLILYSYDSLQRPIRLWAKDRSEDSSVTLREVLIYGDDDSLTGLTRIQAMKLNLLGKLYKHYDEAGLLTFMGDPAIPDSKPYDFKGNVLEKTRQVISDDNILQIFISPSADRKINSYTIDWTPMNTNETFTSVSNRLLDTFEYRTSFKYDALNRIKTGYYPKDVLGKRKLLHLQYNNAGAIQSIKLDDKFYINNIGYNAKGEITIIIFGNGVMTRYGYDKKTSRLKRIRSENYTNPSPLVYRPGGKIFQDLVYEYDLIGNILKISDRSPKSGIPNTLLGVNGLDRTFFYSPIYQLLSATGREHKYSFLQLPPPWNDGNFINDVTQSREYKQEYLYDKIGNIKKLSHKAESSGFIRQFEYVLNSNKLNSMTMGQIGVGGQIYDYTYDNTGNMTREGSLRYFEWNHSNRMKSYYIQSGSSGPSLYSTYLYDSNGIRVKKIVKKQGQNNYEVTVYIEDLFEYHLVKNGVNSQKENNTLHIMDNKRRIATVRIGDPFPEDSTPAIKYNLSDQLNNSTIIIDDRGNNISSEEYTPFGETSFGGFSKKRYRFTGKERDEESGLYYHGARYYPPWLARWINCDPIGLSDGINIYSYVSNNPINNRDPTGKQSTPKPEERSEASGTSEGNTTGITGAAASQFGPAAERFIWNYEFSGEGVRGSQRGFILQNLYTNNPNIMNRDNVPDYDYEPPGQNKVQQIKSTDSTNPKYLRQLTRDATTAASDAITNNPTGTMAGKRPQAVMVTPTDAPTSVGSNINNASVNARKPTPNNPLPPEHIRGIPGIAGKVTRGMTVVGFAFSAFGLGGDLARGDAAMAVGNALGTVGGGLEVYAILSGGAKVAAGVSAMTAGLAIGGMGLAVTSGVSGYRAAQAGDTGGAIAGGIGVGAGLAITGGGIGIAIGIAGAPLLLAGGAVAGVGVGIYHAGRYFSWW